MQGEPTRTENEQRSKHSIWPVTIQRDCSSVRRGPLSNSSAPRNHIGFSAVRLLLIKYAFCSETICNVICVLPDQNIMSVQ